jgi:hypothetical protein
VRDDKLPARVSRPRGSWRSKTGERIVTRDPDQFRTCDTRAYRVTLGAAALIVPENRRSQHFTSIVEQTSPCICPVKPIAITSLPEAFACGKCLFDAVRGGGPPLARLLF